MEREIERKREREREFLELRWDLTRLARVETWSLCRSLAMQGERNLMDPDRSRPL